jgi:uncharacterized protein (TIGR01777 family)
VKVVIAGGSGTLGSSLSAHLAEQGHDVVVLSRRQGGGPHRRVLWDGRTVGRWAEELEGAAVVNLAGALIDRRPTPEGIELLTRSRVEPTRALVEASRQLDQPVSAWLQASTLSIHSDTGDEVLTEDTPVEVGLPQMTGVATAWESAVHGANTEHLTILRTSIVLDRDTPAMDRLVWLARMRVAGTVGPGSQWFSWIHIEDWLRATDLALAGELDGLVHLTSPHPVTNREFMAALRRVVGVRFGLPTPAVLVRVGAVGLRTDPRLVLTGRRGVPQRLLDAGFEFHHPDLEPALRDLLDRSC